MHPVRLARFLACAAGALDFTTGLGFVILPVRTLSLMGVAMPSGDALVFVRFVGAFVAAVGASYLWALLRGGLPRLRSVLEFTLLFRLSAGSFSAIAIALGWLTPAWLGVPLADFTLIGLQLWLLTKLPDSHDASPAPSSY